ncbi:Ribosome production factor 2-like protein [Psilocybe cubensis]|uniref:Ribosome production factor 2-like protein n=2 Tax=Psilocybe cubensis TaxID=181762 RepID=A0ACB8H6V5_PSICU|nr:Ribosome production factor 2-like protein [Psilocybe cubensis]KAH9483523.1 Ribosome production factor 2-like protein [Psilocybe cubensis]
MEANSTENIMPNVFPPPPPGLNYIAAIQPSLTFLMIGTAWGGVLLPLLVALFYFSTKDTRRRPIFILNVLSILLGLFMVFFNAVLEIRAILAPLQPLNPLTSVVFGIVSSGTPLLVEFILVIRLLAVYPFTRTPKPIWCAIFVPLVLIKIGRMVNIIFFSVQYVQLVQTVSGDPISVAQSPWHRFPGIKIEWILQVIDNTATSTLFIFRLKSVMHTPGRTVASGTYRVTYTSKIKALFWIAVSNFVFPVILSIIQLIMLFRDSNFLKGAYTFFTNDYVEIVGVLLATVWASTAHWSDQNPTADIESTKVYSGPSRLARHIWLDNSQSSASTGNVVESLGIPGHIELDGLKERSEGEIGPINKPKNARSKRALEARQPKEVEDPRTAIFVKGTHTGEVLNNVMRELMALKRPNAIAFNKKNAIHPFDEASTSIASLEFWANKNDASMFVFGQTTKKRPHGLTFVRMYDGKVLDMAEVGVENWVGMADFKTPKSTPGHKPLMHFASELFDTHPRFIQLKSMLIDFFNGEEIESICLPGIEHIISISCGPTPDSLNNATAMAYASRPKPSSGAVVEDTSNFPKVHIRTYTLKLLASGTRIPRVELTPMGPSLDLVLRRHQPADAELLKQAMKRPKLKKSDIESGLGKKKKNQEVDEMGDLRGRVHVGNQDLSKLQTRKMKGLKAGKDEMDVDEDFGGEPNPRKKRRTEA